MIRIQHRPDTERDGTETISQQEEKPVGKDNETGEIAPEQTEEKPVGTRKQYLDGLTEYGAAGEIARHIVTILSTARQMDIRSAEHWENWLSEDVDVLGNTWEYEVEP